MRNRSIFGDFIGTDGEQLDAVAVWRGAAFGHVAALDENAEIRPQLWRRAARWDRPASVLGNGDHVSPRGRGQSQWRGCALQGAFTCSLAAGTAAGMPGHRSMLRRSLASGAPEWISRVAATRRALRSGYAPARRGRPGAAIVRPLAARRDSQVGRDARAGTTCGGRLRAPDLRWRFVPACGAATAPLAPAGGRRNERGNLCRSAAAPRLAGWLRAGGRWAARAHPGQRRCRGAAAAWPWTGCAVGWRNGSIQLARLLAPAGDGAQRPGQAPPRSSGQPRLRSPRLPATAGSEIRDRRSPRAHGAASRRGVLVAKADSSALSAEDVDAPCQAAARRARCC